MSKHAFLRSQYAQSCLHSSLKKKKEVTFYLEIIAARYDNNYIRRMVKLGEERGCRRFFLGHHQCVTGSNQQVHTFVGVGTEVGARLGTCGEVSL